MDKHNQDQDQEQDPSQHFKESTTNTKTSQKKEKFHNDPCSICLEMVSSLDVKKYCRYTCCGKVIHITCKDELHASKLSDAIINSCPLCRARSPTSPDSKVVIKRLRKWAKKGKVWAQAMLADSFHGGRGVIKDYKRAAALYALASKQGDVDSQYNLGIMYAEGLGVDPDMKRAIELYNLAAAQGHAVAQNSLGLVYINGDGVQQNYALALRFFKMAAAQGDTGANSNLGAMYVQGHGVDQSYVKAREYFAKAAVKGDEQAIQNLKRLDEMEGKNNHYCLQCSKPETTSHILKYCACKEAKYCNRSCQTAHWKEHKTEHYKMVKELEKTKKKM